MAAVARGMRCTYIDPRATITASKATRYWQVRPKSDYALNLAIIHEVLEQDAYDKDFVARFVSGMDYLREAVKDTTPEWQEPHTGVPAAELRAFVTEIAARRAACDLPSGLDVGSSQAVVLREPLGADPERADGQHRASGRVRAGEAARALRPQGPEPSDRSRAGGQGAARGWCRRRAAAVGSGDRHAAPGLRRDGDGAAVRDRRLLRLPPRPVHRHARPGGDATCDREAEAARLDRRALLGDWAGSPTSSSPSRPTWSARTSCAR